MIATGLGVALARPKKNKIRTGWHVFFGEVFSYALSYPIKQAMVNYYTEVRNLIVRLKRTYYPLAGPVTLLNYWVWVGFTLLSRSIQ